MTGIAKETDSDPPKDEPRETATPELQRVRPSRAEPPFEGEAFKNELVKQPKEEVQSAMSARDTYDKANEKNEA